jgi:DNA-binding transcriptional LysR family regulator
MDPRPTKSPPWDEVRIFLAVVRAGSLVAAAAQLRVSEATVSRHLRALEERLGIRLFDRLPNRVALTSLGRRLVPAATAMEDGLGDFARAAHAATDANEEPIRITATASVSLFLTRHLDRVLAAAPGVRLQLLDTRTALSLAHRDADIALRMRRPPETGNLIVQRIGRLAFGLYAAHHQLAKQCATRFDNHQPVAFIGLRDDPASRQSSWLDAVAADAPMPVRLDDIHLRFEAARRGLGATLLPCFLGDSEPSLRRLLPPPVELIEDVYLLTHEDLKDLPAITAVRSALAGLFRNEAARLLGGAADGEESAAVSRSQRSEAQAVVECP